MFKLSASLVKELREKTGSGMMDCKKALAETDGDINSAIDWLRAKGLSAAAKKSPDLIENVPISRPGILCMP